MTVHIDYKLCNGCPGRNEAACEEICPGDLFYRDSGKAVMREPSDCWDCFACIKACPRAALSVELPFQISETKHRLTARVKNNHINWKLLSCNGKTLAKYSIPNRTASSNNEKKKRDRNPGLSMFFPA